MVDQGDAGAAAGTDRLGDLLPRPSIRNHTDPSGLCGVERTVRCEQARKILPALVIRVTDVASHQTTKILSGTETLNGIHN
ncbi:hypothetical protein SANTM175S_09174 [Streptomyces antimycoticus]